MPLGWVAMAAAAARGRKGPLPPWAQEPCCRARGRRPPPSWHCPVSPRCAQVLQGHRARLALRCLLWSGCWPDALEEVRLSLAESRATQSSL